MCLLKKKTVSQSLLWNKTHKRQLRRLKMKTDFHLVSERSGLCRRFARATLSLPQLHILSSETESGGSINQCVAVMQAYAAGHVALPNQLILAANSWLTSGAEIPRYFRPVTHCQLTGWMGRRSGANQTDCREARTGERKEFINKRLKFLKKQRELTRRNHINQK